MNACFYDIPDCWTQYTWSYLASLFAPTNVFLELEETTRQKRDKNEKLRIKVDQHRKFKGFAFDFSSPYYCRTKHQNHENERNNYQVMKLLIVKQISLTVPYGMYEFRLA